MIIYRVFSPSESVKSFTHTHTPTHTVDGGGAAHSPQLHQIDCMFLTVFRIGSVVSWQVSLRPLKSYKGPELCVRS